MKKKNDEKIDFVVLWVDPTDKEWQKQKAKYSKGAVFDSCVDNSEDRYRDWELFKYWFRGVEKFAPWVNKIHLVTCGHYPKWLNRNHPKINLVNHSDIIPNEYLPTFNSNAILLNVHKIKGLSERFVLFNDDCFIIRSVKETNFFKNGTPVDTMSLLAITHSKDREYGRTLVNNIEIVNNHFDFNDFKKDNIAKCLSLKQGKYLLTTIPLLAYDCFPGFKNYHIGNSYLKTTFFDVWSAESEVLNKTVSMKFRDYANNVSEWLMNYWQFAEGKIVQRSSKFGINAFLDDDEVYRIIEKQKRHIVCLSEPKGNDVAKEIIKARIHESFDRIFPDKCEFEI